MHVCVCGVCGCLCNGASVWDEGVCACVWGGCVFVGLCMCVVCVPALMPRRLLPCRARILSPGLRVPSAWAGPP